MAYSAEDRRKVARGTLFTVLGGVAFAVYQGSDFALRGVFGLEAFGLYTVAAALVEVCGYLILAGFLDSVTYFAANRLYGGEGERAREEELYRALATAIVAPLLLALAAAGALSVAAPWIHRTFWSAHDPAIVPIVTTAGWSLPLLVLVYLPAEALKSRLEVHWSVGITQVLLPYLTGACAVALHLATGVGILAMSQGFLLAAALCAPVSLYAFSRRFSLGRTLRAAATLRFDGALLAFALPQSLNMALNLAMTRIDTMVLSAIVSAEALGMYGLIVRSTQLVRLVKMAFSGLFGPLVAKYHAARNREGVREALHSFARLTGALGIPVLLVVMAIYPDIVLLRRGLPWGESRLFPWLLTAGPLMSCFFGFAGNLLLMTGHARLLLLNAAASATLNLGLSLWLAPRYGLLGAALATAVSNVAISSLQIAEAARVEGYRFTWRMHRRTVLAAAGPVALVAALHAPAVRALLPGAGDGAAWGLDLAVGGAAVALYLGLHLLAPGTSALRIPRRGAATPAPAPEQG